MLSSGGFIVDYLQNKLTFSLLSAVSQFVVAILKVTAKMVPFHVAFFILIKSGHHIRICKNLSFQFASSFTPSTVPWCILSERRYKTGWLTGLILGAVVPP